MKRMKKWLAVILMSSMVAGSTATQSFAAVSPAYFADVQQPEQPQEQQETMLLSVQGTNEQAEAVNSAEQAVTDAATGEQTADQQEGSGTTDQTPAETPASQETAPSDGGSTDGSTPGGETTPEGGSSDVTPSGDGSSDSGETTPSGHDVPSGDSSGEGSSDKEGTDGQTDPSAPSEGSVVPADEQTSEETTEEITDEETKEEEEETEEDTKKEEKHYNYTEPLPDDQITDTTPVRFGIMRAPLLKNASKENELVKNFKAEVFYGGTWKDVDGQNEYVWTAPSSSAAHRFNFRISFTLGEDTAEGTFLGSDDGSGSAVKITVPKSILNLATGEKGDTYDMSVPSRDDVLESIASGEQLDADMSFAYYEDGDNLVLYNFRDIDPGFDAFIEMSYVTSNVTFDYKDMSESDEFTAKIEAKMTTEDGTEIGSEPLTSDPVTVFIDTQVELKSTESRYPVSYDSWPWGTAPTAEEVGKVKDKDGNEVDFNSNDYTYLVWEIRSRINDNSQMYDFSLSDEFTKLTASLDGVQQEVPEGTVIPIAAHFSGTGKNDYTLMEEGSATQKDQKVNGLRYDYILTAVRKDFWNNVDHWEMTNDTTVTVTPIIDPSKADGERGEPQEATYRRTFTWNKPVFDGGPGRGGAYKWADGAFRTQSNKDVWPRVRLTDLGMQAGYFSRYDLDMLIKGSAKYLDNLDYAVGAEGYVQKYTKDRNAGAEIRPEDYFKEPVKYVVTDDTFYVYDENEGLKREEEYHMSAEDYRIDSIAFKLSPADYAYNESTAAFDRKTGTVYLEDCDLSDEAMTDIPDNFETETLAFYGKFGTNDEWVHLADFRAKTKTLENVNGDYLDASKCTASKLVFIDREGDADTVDSRCVGYKVETYNTHYYSLIGTVPNIRIYYGTHVQNAVTEQSSTEGDDDTQYATTAIGVNNRMSMEIFEYKSEKDGATQKERDAAQQEGRELLEDPYSHKVYNGGSSDADFIRVVMRESNLTKEVTGTSNAAKYKQYTVTWKIHMEETYTEDSSGTEKLAVRQNGGVFYDLLPEGSSLQTGSVMVEKTDKNAETGAETMETLRANQYTVDYQDNYKGTNRQLIIVTVKEPGDKYDLSYTSVHPYESLRDYGNLVYNPVVYETGNADIKDGVTNTQTPKPIAGTTNQDGTGTQYMTPEHAALVTPVPSSADDSAAKFIYTEREYDIAAITAAASGISKKVQTTNNSTYANEGITPNKQDYSYRLRYQNSYANEAAGIIFYDTIEAYKSDENRESDWHGTLVSVDLGVMEDVGIAPVVYVSNEKQEIKLDTDLTTWEKVDDYKTYDYSSVKTIAIDASHKADGSEFALEKGGALTAYLYMKAPQGASREDGTPGYPEAYNSLWVRSCVKTESSTEEPRLAEQAYTTTGLVITGNVNVKKISPEMEGIYNITFRLRGTSDYGTEIDKKESSDRNGYLMFKDIEKGTYILSEYEGTPDWLMDSTEHTVKITDEGKVLIDDTDCTETEYEITNMPRVHTDLRLMKKQAVIEGDDSQKPIPDTTFQLTGTSDYGNEINAIGTSTAVGVALLSNIEIGTYKLKEIKANEDYKPIETEYKVVVSGTTNEDVTVKIYEPVLGPDGEPTTEYQEVPKDGVYPLIYNTPKYWNFTLLKVDAENTSRRLQGAEFELSGGTFKVTEEADDGTETTTTTDKLTAISDENGRVTFENVEAGSYILKETKTPSGVDGDGHTGTGGTLNYLADSNEYIVEIADDGSVKIQGLKKTSSGLYMVKNARSLDGEIIVYKKWEDIDPSARTTPKIHLVPDPESLKYRGITVTKQWEGDYPDARPDNVNVKLVKQKNQINGYTLVDYIESPSNGGASINTGVNPTNLTSVDITTEVLGNNVRQSFFGVRALQTGAPAFSLCEGHQANHDLTGYFFAEKEGDYDNIIEMGALDRNKKYTLHLGADGAIITDGTEKTRFAVPDDEFALNYPLYLFDYNSGDNGRYWSEMYGRIYSARIYENGVLIRDFVPVYSEASGYGLYDLANDQFYGSAGSRPFTGPAVETTGLTEVGDTSDGSWKKSGDIWTYTFDVEVDGTEQFYAYETENPEDYTGSATGVEQKVAVNGGKVTITNTYQAEPVNFPYTGAVQSYTIPESGYYKLEAWGAQGGGAIANGSRTTVNGTPVGVGGKGAYTKGTVYLEKGTEIYVYVGQKGTNSSASRYTNWRTRTYVDNNGNPVAGVARGGWNGGGWGVHDDYDNDGSGGGGGATDFRLVMDTTSEDGWSSFDSLKSRIMVAGAGAGSNWTVNPSAGALTVSAYSSGNGRVPGTTQTSGYEFGRGQSGYLTANNTSTQGSAGGGGGYYGGCTAGFEAVQARGGNSYISGYSQCDAVAANSTASNIIHTGQPDHYSGYTFTNMEMRSGNSPMVPNVETGELETGHSGNGYARITFVSHDNPDAGGSSETPSGEDPVLPSTEYVSEDSGWTTVDENTEKYVFKVFNDNAEFQVWEENIEGYSSTAYLNEDGEGGLSLDGSKQKSIVVTNTATASFGELTVKKIIEGIDSSQSFDFTLTLTGDKIKTGTQTIGGVIFTNGAATFSLAGGEEKVFTSIPVGTTYAVTEATETIQDTFETTASNDTGTIVAEPETPLVATFTNKYIPPVVPLTDINLSKVVTGSKDESDAATEYTFYLTFTGLEKSLEYRIVKGEEVVGRFTSDESGNASTTVALKDGETVAVKDVLAGATYQITEEAGDYISSFKIVDANKAGSIVQTGGENTQVNQSLATQTETVDATGTDAETKVENVTVTFTNKLAGTQRLTVAKAVSKKIATEAAEDFTVTVHFFGLEPNSTIDSTIGRWVADGDGEAYKDFSLRDGKSVSFANVPIGATYTVEEAKNPYIATYKVEQAKTDTADDGTTSTTKEEKSSGGNEAPNQKMTVPEQKIKRHWDDTVTITNTQAFAPITLRKTVTGSMGSKSKKFDFEITIPDMKGQTVQAAGSDTSYTFNGEGKLTVKLSHGDEVTIPGIIVGAQYTIQEKGNLGYTVTYKIDGAKAAVQGDSLKGSLATNGLGVGFTNDREAVVPTGVDLGGLAPILLILIGAIGLVLMRARKRYRA